MTDTPTDTERARAIVEQLDGNWDLFDLYPKQTKNDTVSYIAAALERARREEREACAQVAETMRIDHDPSQKDALAASIYEAANKACTIVAQAIRSRDEVQE